MSKSDNKTMSRSERKKQKKNKKSNKGGLWKKILLGMLGVILAVLVVGSALFAYYASDAPELTEEDLTGTYASELVDMNGEVFYTTGGQEREFAVADEYPEVMRDAMKAIEDQRFDSHLGVDPIGIGRAALGLVMNQEIVGGGSTITQQLIKNSVFSTLEEDQTLERKAQEAWLAIQLEQQLSKEQIMTLYLNKIHMGSNVSGVATAAEEYYGKHVSELELHEAAMFAGMPRAPNYYNPYVNEEAAKNRRDTVLQAMVDVESITQEEADEAMQIPVTEGLQEPTEDSNALVFDGYITLVKEEVERKTNYDNIDNAGLTIQTNYDPNAQQVMFDVINSDEYVNYPDEELQTASTLIDSTSGQITAMIGARNIDSQLSLNYAIDGKRDVGSTMKPLSTYAPAIELLQYSTYHQVYDEPYELGNWNPSNYDNDYEGQMSMREALVDSRNVPTAKLFNEDLGGYHEEIINFLESVGINTETLNSGSDSLVRSNAISGTMSPRDLAGAYQAFANNGNYIEPYAVRSITTQNGEEIDLTPEANKVMEESTAYMINDMLKEVIDYYGSQLPIPGYTHAAKTGTTNFTEEEMEENNYPSGAVPDNWIVGYSPYYTMSVWVGYDQRLGDNYLTFDDGSRSLARDVYREAISRLTEDFEQRDWQQPDSVVELSIEDGTDPAQLAAPGSSNTVSELFVRENQPNTRAEPEELDLSAPSGLSANYDANSDTISVNWDAYEINENIYGDVQYVLNMNGQEQVVSGTSYQFDSPPTGDVSISLAVRADGNTGPSSSVQVTVPDPSEDEDTEDEENDGEEEEPPEDSDPENEEDSDSEDEEPPQDSENEEDNDSDSDAENDNDNENNDNPSEDHSSDNGSNDDSTDNSSNDDSSGESNNDDNNNNNADGESDPPPNDE